MSDIFRVPSDREPIIDPTTGLIGRSWFLFFQDLFRRVGGSTGTGNAAFDSALTAIKNEIAFADSSSASVSELADALESMAHAFSVADVPSGEIGKRISDVEVFGAFSR
jgi:hypothetical protein